MVTLAYFLAFIGLGLAGAALGPTLPYLAEQTRTNFGQISILFVARSLGYLGGSALAGYLFDRLPGHPLMAITLIGLGITLFLTPQISLLWILMAVLTLTGIAQGGIDVGGNTLIVWQHGKNVGPYMNALHMFYGIGSFLAPVIVAQAILIRGSITWGYWVIAAFMFLPAMQLFSLPSPQAESERGEDTTGRSTRLLVLLAATFLFCYSSFANIFGGWIFSYVVELELSSKANAAYVTSLFWGAFTVGRLISIPVAARFRPNSILLADLVGCLLSTTIILVWPISIYAIWIGAAGLGLSAAALFPTTVSLVERRMQISGRVTSRFVIGSALGAMIPPWIVGQFFETTGAQMVIYSVFVTILVGFGVYIFLRRETLRS